LYYATTDTERRRLGLTAIPAEWLNQQLEDCLARRVILMLDCCHSGAFARGAKGASALALQEKFGGRGKIVLTASGATEYSFEGDSAVGDDVRSVFTHSVVQGLRTGAADRDKDGEITVDDLYDYVYDEVRAAEPRQTPKKWVYGAEGRLVVAASVRGAIVAPVALSKHVTEILESPHVEVRESGVKVLARLLEEGALERAPTDRQKGLAQSARGRLRRISEEDLPRIAEQARAALSADSGEATSDLKPAGEASSEILSESPRRKASGPTTGSRNNTRFILPPLDQAAVPGLEAKVSAFTEKIATVHPYDIEHEKLLTDIQTMGDDETRRVREGCARLQTDEPFTEALSKIRTSGDPLSGLQPTWLDRIGTRYVERLRTYESHIDAVVASLRDIQDALGKGAAAIRLNGLMIQESMLRIRQYLFVAERLELELSEIAARADSLASEIDDGASSAATAARQRYAELEAQMTVADATYRVVRSVDADTRELDKHFESVFYGLRNLKIAASVGDVEGFKATLIESSAILSSIQADLSELSSRIRRLRGGSSKFKT
jgi:hypothetical protein